MHFHSFSSTISNVMRLWDGQARAVSTPCEFIDPPIPAIRRRREREKGIFLSFSSFLFSWTDFVSTRGKEEAVACARMHARTQSFTNSKVGKAKERDFWLIFFSIPRSGACRFASFDSIQPNRSRWRFYFSDKR